MRKKEQKKNFQEDRKGCKYLHAVHLSAVYATKIEIVSAILFFSLPFHVDVQNLYL